AFTVPIQAPGGVNPGNIYKILQRRAALAIGELGKHIEGLVQCDQARTGRWRSSLAPGLARRTGWYGSGRALFHGRSDSQGVGMLVSFASSVQRNTAASILTTLYTVRHSKPHRPRWVGPLCRTVCGQGRP